MSVRRPVGLASLAGALVLHLAVRLSAQAPPPQSPPAQPPPPLKNLQVFPKDIPRAQLIQAMGGFASALGVACAYCHDVEAGRATNDFSSDVKPTKHTARVMMLMVRDVNAKLDAELGRTASEAIQVQCVTCHRGVAQPRQLADILSQTLAQKGAAGAIAQYRELRTKDDGGQSYDFSENGLLGVGQRLVEAEKPDEALAMLQLNLEFFPQSARTYQALGEAYARKSDSANAVKNLEKSLELDPQNAGVKRRLDQLKKAGQ